LAVESILYFLVVRKEVLRLSPDVSSFLTQILPIIAIFAVFMFLIIIPQRRRNKKIKDMLDNVKPGNWIRTVGGLYGKAIQVKEDLVVFECGPDKVQLEISKSAIATVQGAEVENEISEKDVAKK
jgi:preprotein translocase subunit YajC